MVFHIVPKLSLCMKNRVCSIFPKKGLMPSMVDERIAAGQAALSSGKGLPREMVAVTRLSNNLYSSRQVLDPDSKSYGEELDSTIQETFVKAAAKLKEYYTSIHTSTEEEEVMTMLGQMEGAFRFRRKLQQDKVEYKADYFKVKLTFFFSRQ